MSSEVQQAGDSRDKAYTKYTNNPTPENERRFRAAEVHFHRTLEHSPIHDDDPYSDYYIPSHNGPSVLEALTGLALKTFDKVRMFGYQRLTGGRF